MPNKHNEPRRHHIPKQRYKVSNWSDYNRSLQQRGRPDLWINDDLIESWYHSERVFDGTGSTPLYTDQAILVCHELRVIYKQPLRQAQGFIDALFEMANLPLKCPHYTLLSKRLSQLNIKKPHYRKRPEPDDEPVAIAIDSTEPSSALVVMSGTRKNIAFPVNGVGAKCTWGPAMTTISMRR